MHVSTLYPLKSDLGIKMSGGTYFSKMLKKAL